MSKKLFVFILVIFSLLFSTTNAYAVSNNKFGIHIADTSNLEEVSKLINSNGGDWGYVTFVIQKGERDTARWQQVMDRMRELHIIPIVRIATSPIAGNSNTWEIPNDGEIDGWVSFLNSLNWVIKDRYVIIGNEPNHASEWGGQLDPAGYANYLSFLSRRLKEVNPDFFIMPAGFDASAANLLNAKTDATMDEALYIQKMFEANPHVFDYIDGWSSHSYPNPGFSGPGDGEGKGTVSTYKWELDYLKLMGFPKDLPVFITETGWIHDIDTTITDIGPKIETAFKNVWNDSRIVTVTPFIYKYTEAPFDVFSWINKEGQTYDFYNNYLNLAKTKGDPIQIIKGELQTGFLPKIATVNSSFHAVIFVKNTGQSIWQINNLSAIDEKQDKLTVDSIFPENVKPNQIGFFVVKGKFPSVSGPKNIKITLISHGEVIASFSQESNLIPKFPNLGEVWDYIKMKLFNL